MSEEIISVIPAGDDSDPKVKAVLDGAVEQMDGRTQWFWVVTSNSDVLLACWPTGSVYEEISQEIWDDVNRYSGDRIKEVVTHERTQRLLLDP